MSGPLFEDSDDAATPLTPDEKKGLIPSYITLRRELNEAEQLGIITAEEWAFSRKRDVLDEAFLRPAHFVSAETDILSIVKIFNAQRTSNVLVRDDSVTPPALGIFTATALQRAILTGRPLDQLPVKELALFLIG